MKQLSQPHEITITGFLLAIGVAPIFIYIEQQRFLPIFSTEPKLRESMRLYNVVQPYRIHRINHGREFLECLWSQDVPVVLDPYPHKGNTRYKLLVPIEDARSLS